MLNLKAKYLALHLNAELEGTMEKRKRQKRWKSHYIVHLYEVNRVNTTSPGSAHFPLPVYFHNYYSHCKWCSQL